KAFAMLPATTQAKVRGLQQKADALNKQLHDGKLTFGDYNVRRIELLTRMTASLANFLESSEPARAETTAQDHARAPRSMVPVENIPSKPPQLPDLRIALVIGESRYVALPKLANAEADARSIADAFKNMGYDTRLLLDANQDVLRKEIRRLAKDSSKAA